MKIPEGYTSSFKAPEPEESAPVARRTSWTARELLVADLPLARFAVEGLLPEGLTFMAGAPKLGKSWLALALGIAVSCGGYALGKVPVVQGDVLYLALEDNARRLQDRLRLLLNGAEAPDGFHFELEWPRLDAGGADGLDDWLSAHPDARLLLVDVYPRIRPQSKGRDLYQTDYEGAAQLQALAISHGVAVVALHHTRKAEAVDFVETVQGTFGTAGAADTIVVVKRARGEADATLLVTGRDVVEQELALRFAAAAGTWELLGPAAEHDLHETRKTILEAVAAHGRLTPKRLSELTPIGHDLAKMTMWRMANDGQLAAASGFYTSPVTAVTETLEAAWLSEEERLQADKGAVTEEPESVTELQRLQGSRGSVTAPAVGDVVRCDEHGRDTTVKSIDAGLVFLACGCHITYGDPEEAT